MRTDELSNFKLSDIMCILREVGVCAGARIMLHSSLRDCGKLSDVAIPDHPKRIVEAVLDLLGPSGTLCVPASNWDYGRNRQPFDVHKSPVSREMGVVSRYVLTLPGHIRSVNPIFSIAAIGADAARVCGNISGNAFGTGSAWERMFEGDYLNVFLGCGIEALTFARYIEHRHEVPYLYTKLFQTPVLDDGKVLDVTVTAPLRYGFLKIEYDLQRLENRLRQDGCLKESCNGRAAAKAVSMASCYRVGSSCLQEDIHYFLASAPEYGQGKEPIL